MDTDEILALFIDPYSGAYTGAWVAGGYRYACDGRSICRVKTDAPDAVPDGNKAARSMNADWWDWRDVSEPAPGYVPPSAVDCQRCDGEGRFEKCPDCHGHGTVDVTYHATNGESYDVEAECPVCWDWKDRQSKCDVCGGSGKAWGHHCTRILDTLLADSLLARLHMIGAEIRTAKVTSIDVRVVVFRAGDIEGLAMPMNQKTTTKERIRELVLAES